MGQELLLVGAGGFIGSILRYLLWLATRSQGVTSFPVATFLVNLIGCFAIGLLSVSAEKHFADHPGLVLFLGVGLLGGFTTFSAFGLDTFLLWKNQGPATAALYSCSSLILGFSAVALGRMGASRFF